MDQEIAGPKPGQAEGPPAEQPDGLNDVAALLAEQFSACHAAAARCFAIAGDEEEYEMPARLEALKLATKLVQASATAASAVKRIKGGQFHHHVTVHRFDYAAEKAARKARIQAAKTVDGDAKRKLLLEKIQRVVEHERSKLTPEERATIDRIHEEAEKRPYPDFPQPSLESEDGETA